MAITFQVLILGGLLTLGILLVIQARTRSGRQVLADLQLDWPAELGGPAEERAALSSLGVAPLSDELGTAGLHSPRERRRFILTNRLWPIGCAFVFVTLQFVFVGRSPSTTVLVLISGLALGYLLSRLRVRRRQREYKRELEFYLPLTMENLVMAVQAGLDIIAALKSVLALSVEHSPNGEPRPLDPVSQLLSIVVQLTEAGRGFEESLRLVAQHSDCSALRHAFIHLALAHKEGGELVMPLRELSNSTQLYYQETIEEDIARMPVKATLPLLVTFSGLLLCFITVPVIQVISIMVKATPQ